jgi:hypothetical protein
MSVDSRRHAAAQRTAARSDAHRRPWKLIATWLLIIPTLSFFSFTVVAGATTFGQQPDYNQAVQELAKADKSVTSTSAGTVKSDKVAKIATVVVVVEASDGGFLAQFKNGSSKQAVCRITKSQLTQVSLHYTTGMLSYSSGGTTYSVVRVAGATESGLRSYLGVPGITCKLVQVSHVFFLPFDANTS